VGWYECFKHDVSCLSSDIYIKRWNGSSWEQFNKRIIVADAGDSAFSLALDHKGKPMVSYSGWESPVSVNTFSIYVMRDVPGIITDPWKTLANKSSNKLLYRYFSMGLKSNNHPVVAWIEQLGNVDKKTLKLQEWGGSNWTTLATYTINNSIGDFVMATRYKTNQSTPSLDDPIGVAWVESIPSANKLRVLLRVGNQWKDFSMPATKNNTAIGDVALSLDNSGLPVIAWEELNYMDYTIPHNIYVARWNGSKWIKLGSSLGSPSPSTFLLDGFDLKVDSLDRPVFGFRGDISRWNGSSWRILGSKLGFNPKIAFDLSSNPIIAYNVFPNNESTFPVNLYVARWNGTSWNNLGQIDITPNNGVYEQTHSITVDSLDRPIVAWLEPYIYIKRWNKNKWELIGNKVDDSEEGAGLPIVLTQNTRPIVGWYSTLHYGFYVKQQK
jgi:hypothetical protein